MCEIFKKIDFSKYCCCGLHINKCKCKKTTTISIILEKYKPIIEKQKLKYITK